MASSRAGTASNQGGQEWTAIKCGRLLRHLTTTISTLRKHVHQQRKINGPESGEVHMLGHECVTAVKRKGLSEESNATTRKRIRHTYSLKHSKEHGSGLGWGLIRTRAAAPISPSSEARTARPGIHMETPVTKRLFGMTLTPSPARGSFSGYLTLDRNNEDSGKAVRSGECWHPKHPSNDLSVKGACHNGYCDIEVHRRRSGRVIGCENGLLNYYDAIYKHLDALLRATSTGAPGAAAPKSLLAMCLRKLPDYITEVEYWTMKELQENGTRSFLEYPDVSSQVYGELESVYGTAKCGWKHLAVLVQSHGIKLVTEAIMEGLFDKPYADLLARVCSQAQPSSDHAQLFGAALIGQRDWDPALDNGHAQLRTSQLQKAMGGITNMMAPVHPLPKWTKPLAVTLMTELLGRKVTPDFWILADSFGTLWSAVVTDMTTKSPGYGTKELVTTAIQALGSCTGVVGRITGDAKSTGENVARARQSYIDALSVLTTMMIIGQNTLEIADISLNIRSRIKMICRRVEYTLRTCLAHTRGSRGVNARKNTCLLQLALFFSRGFLALPNIEDDNLLASFWPVLKERADPNDQRYSGTIALMSAIARSCHRKPTDEPARVYLAKLCDRLERASPTNVSGKKMRIEAAFYLAEQTGDVADFIYAERLANKAKEDINRTAETPTKDRAFAGFRWDEGISEWVTATPVIARKARTINTRSRGRAISPDGLLEEADTSGSEQTSRSVKESFSSSVSSSASIGTSCRAKTAITRKAWSRIDPGRSDRGSPEITSQLDGPGDDDDDVDELSFCLDQDQGDQKDRPPKRDKTAAKTNQTVKRRRSRRSLLSSRSDPKVVKQQYEAESSDDELGM